jgi:hypothetical protein
MNDIHMELTRLKHAEALQRGRNARLAREARKTARSASFRKPIPRFSLIGRIAGALARESG